MKKHISCLLVLCLLLALLPVRTQAAQVEVLFYDEAAQRSVSRPARPVELLLDGAALESDVPALLVGGRTLVPLRALGEALGVQVSWLDDTRQVTLRRGDTSILLTLGSATASVNGVEFPLPGGVPAALVTYGGQNRTMVPLRFVAEQLGAGVGWNGRTYTATVTSSPVPGYSFTAPLDPGSYTIAIDPGHGGLHSGAYYEGVAEKSVNLSVARLLRDRLKSLGYHVVMTLDGDDTVDLYRRCDIANAAGADIFISLHSNASVTSSTFQGIFTYYYPGSSQGEVLAQAIQSPVCAVTGAIDQGILSENFVVVRETHMPAVLVEMGFMSTHAELLRLIDPEYQRKLAWGVAEGAVRYLNSLHR